MKIHFLGTGTSTGIPEIGCECAVCTSNNPKDKRLRASALVEVNDKRILIDCSPDFREQILPFSFAPIDGVLLTHEHYDHVGGIDDLRPFCKFKDVEIYSNKIAIEALKTRMPYCFKPNPYPGVPMIKVHEVDENKQFNVLGIDVMPIRVMHLNLPILGYRIENFAYLTDVKTIPDDEYKKLQNLDVLVISALRIESHFSHQNLEEALEQVKRIAPRETYFIHMSHGMGMHDDIQKQLLPNVYFAYDGLTISTSL